MKINKTLLESIRQLISLQYLAILVLPSILDSNKVFSLLLFTCIMFLFLYLKKFYFLSISFPLFVINSLQLIYYFLIEKKAISTSIFDFVFNVNNEELIIISKNYYYLFILLLVYVSLTYCLFKSTDILKTKNLKPVLPVFISAITLLIVVLIATGGYKSSYLSLIYSRYYKAKLNNQKRLNFEETVRNFSFGFTRSRVDNDTIVIVIGESSRAQNYSLYGYKRKTNPLLEMHDNLYKFTAYTPFILTAQSVPYALNRIPYKNYSEKLYTEKSIITAMKEAGYTTYFLNNNSHDISLIHYYINESDNFINTGKPMGPDDKVVPLFKKILKDKSRKKLIIIHLYGSHFIYNERYPSGFSVYKPDSYNRITYANRKEIVNSYDNTVLYTDYVINNLITELKKTGTTSSLIFFSDHGENLFDTDEKLKFHVNFNKYTYRIPFIIWFSEDFISRRKTGLTLKDNSRKLTDTKCLFHTLMDIAGMDSKFFDTSKSLLNPNFKAQDSVHYYDSNNEPVATSYEE